MKITSPDFKNGGKIPPKFTCDGDNINPELHIIDVPEKARSLVLIMDDPDVPEFVRADRMWVHLVVFNIPPNVETLPQNSTLPGTMGKGTGGQLVYEGPCPPDREHRYFFKLYALDCMLDLAEGATKKELEKAMIGHILSQAELMGTYNRPA
ncbi:MAG: YbhB/YbcL family Raf kinase inhibitor-like protein [Chlamydiota bacterium]